MTHSILINLYDHGQISIVEVTSKTTFLQKTIFIIVSCRIQSTRNAGRQTFYFFENSVGRSLIRLNSQWLFLLYSVKFTVVFTISHGISFAKVSKQLLFRFLSHRLMHWIFSRMLMVNSFLQLEPCRLATFLISYILHSRAIH